MEELDEGLSRVVRGVKELYDPLFTATKLWYEAKQALQEVEIDLDRKIATALLDNYIVGKNEKEREGHALRMFPKEYAALDQARRNEAEARLERNLAELAIACLRDMHTAKRLTIDHINLQDR